MPEQKRTPFLYADLKYSTVFNVRRRVLEFEVRSKLAQLLIEMTSDGREYVLRQWMEEGVVAPQDLPGTRVVRAYALVLLLNPQDAGVGEFVHRGAFPRDGRGEWVVPIIIEPPGRSVRDEYVDSYFKSINAMFRLTRFGRGPEPIVEVCERVA